MPNELSEDVPTRAHPTVVAIIPARGGSKRLPRKNILPFAGVPLLVHSIRQAKVVHLIARTIVSTDDVEIATIAERAGAQVIMRPAELSHDHATTASALRHVLGVLAAKGERADVVVTLQPNCPLRPPALLRRAIALFLKETPDSVVSVTESRHKLGAVRGGYFEPQYKTGMRSQDMNAQFYENGIVYVSRADMIAEREDLFGERMLALETEPLYALGDIDTPLDFEVAEFLYCAHRERFATGTTHHEEERV
jgi:N-acylneuraminate cytidylyltransferase